MTNGDQSAAAGDAVFEPLGDLFGQTYPGVDRLPDGHLVPPLSSTDLDLAWGLDFHYPRGILPLSHELVSILAASSRSAAEALPAVTGRGVQCRVVGPHVYTAGIPVPDPRERAERAAAAAAKVIAYPQTFADVWRQCERELDLQFGELATMRLSEATTAELHAAFERAIGHFRRAWAIHFDVMYPMLAVADALRTVCRALNVQDAECIGLMGTGDCSIRRTDVALRRLARAAREAGLGPLLDRRTGLVEALCSDPRASGWLREFEHFLSVHGERSDAIVDVGARAWKDEPEQVLGLIRDLVFQRADAPTDAKLSQVEHERQARTERLIARLHVGDRQVFVRALEQARMANFAWWNEEHNSVIDLRAHLPVARVAGEMAVRFGLGRCDGDYLFTEEVRNLGDLTNASAAVAERRRYFASWRERRAQLPRAFGTPSTINDPVLAEIVGVPPTPVDDPTARVLHGLGSAPGVVRGPARVVVTPDQLHRVAAGDILVCEATSPSWTVVFPRLRGCICDAGGALTHAAIICREYALPCVTSVGIATRTIRDGDWVQIDGGAGTVTMLGEQARPV